MWILVWELEDGNGEYSGIQLFQLLPDTALTLLLLGTAQSIAPALRVSPFDPSYGEQLIAESIIILLLCLLIND